MIKGLLGIAALLIAVAAGCGTVPSPQFEPVEGTAAPVDAKAQTTTSSKFGGYYLDDGPEANPRQNLDAVPDAKPRAEPLRASTLRPYTVMGRTYTPMTRLEPYRAQGSASWYGKRYHGKPTASGEIYDMYRMTAAHPTLPIPSYVRVRHLANGKSVVVRINDRGPFHAERLIDLSYTAAHKLRMLAGGSSLVAIESIDPTHATAASIKTVSSEAIPYPSAEQAGGSTSPPLHFTAEGSDIYLQLGAFSGRENAEGFLFRVQSGLTSPNDLTRLHSDGTLYKVQAGPYRTRDEALLASTRIEQALGFKPVLPPQQ